MTNDDEQNLIVEFIGPSGAGKSTYAKKYKDYTSLECVIWKNIYEPIYEYNKKQARNLTLKEELATSYHLIVFNYKVSKLLKKDYSEIRKIKRLKFLVDLLFNDLISLNVKGCIIQHEGIFHNFTNEFIELAGHNPNAFNDSLKNRAFINITGFPETIYEHIKKREKENNRILKEHKQEKERVLKYCADSLARKKVLMNLIREQGKPCLEISLNNPVEESLSMIDRFIKKQITYIS